MRSTLLFLVARMQALRSSRLVANGGANLLGLVNVTLVQIVSVPVFITAFGVEGYGIWLILSTIPAYLTLSDLGLLAAAQADMSMKAASERYEQVLTVFQTVSTAAVALFGIVVILAALLIALTAKMSLWPAELRPHLWAIPAWCAYIFLYMASFTSVAALRATGHYARGTLMHDISSLLEALSMMVAGWMTGSLVLAAVAPAVLRLITMIPIYREMRRLRPYLYWGYAHFCWSELKRLLPAALGSLAIPIALAANLQGSVLIVGAILGPAAVATFAPVRTVSRIAVALLGVFNRAMLPELSAAHGRNDVARQRRYWRLNSRLSLIVLGPTVLLLGVFGAPIVSLWTWGAIVPTSAFVAAIAFSAGVHGLWFYRFMLLSASNTHASIGACIVVLTLAGLVMVALGAARLGLLGVGLSLVMIETLMAILLEWHLRRRAHLQNAEVRVS